MKFLAGLHLLSIVGSIDASGIADDNNKGRVGSIRELPAYPQRLPLSVGDVDGDLSLEPVSIGNGTPILSHHPRPRLSLVRVPHKEDPAHTARRIRVTIVVLCFPRMAIRVANPAVAIVLSTIVYSHIYCIS